MKADSTSSTTRPVSWKSSGTWRVFEIDAGPLPYKSKDLAFHRDAGDLPKVIELHADDVVRNVIRESEVESPQLQVLLLLRLHAQLK